MKKLFLTLSFIFLLSLTQAQKASRVKIIPDPSVRISLQHLGIAVEEGEYTREGAWITDLNEEEIRNLQKLGIPYEILIGNVTEFYKNRYLESIQRTDFAQKLDLQELIYQVPEHFYLGSMGGFCTWQQIQTQLDSMALLFPNLVKAKEPISPTNSIENRPIFWMKISDNPNVDETEPEVLYTALHHAREPIGVQQLLFFMWYLLENYENDSLVKYLVDNSELYFVPVINPDGYVYNELTNPLGGGNWRKNRRNTGTAYGIDINRNYGYMWGLDDQGSSPDPNEETYRGASAFSEPETRNIRDFCNAHSFRLCLNYHSYANKLLYSWGYSDTQPLTPDDSIFEAYAKILTADNHYFYGPGATAIYMTNGGSDDWMYGEQVSKPKILAYTPEVGSSDDGFWPAPENIIPLCHINMSQNIHAALLCIKHADAIDRSGFNLPDIYGYLKTDIRKLGAENPVTYEVWLEPLTSNVVAVGNPKTYSGLGYMQTVSDSLFYQLSQDIETGEEVRFLLNIRYDGLTFRDTLTKVYGSLLTLFEDSCQTLENWNGDWALTFGASHSPTASMTDSPGGDYTSFTNSSFTSDPIVLPQSEGLYLNFWAKWSLEPDYDFVQLKITTDNGQSWTPLKGKFTQDGTFSQAFMEPVYDGVQNVWVEEQADLSAFAGNTVQFRFTLMSDAFVEYDGFYFDDFTVYGLVPGTGTGEVLPDAFYSEAVPNPARNACTIRFRLPGNEEVNLVLRDLQGKAVLSMKESAAAGSFRLNLENLSPGMYFYTLTYRQTGSVVRKLIIR